MTQILGLSGKKQSGKNTAVNYILGLHMRSLGIIRNRFKISDKGELRVSDFFGNEEYMGTFDIMEQNDTIEKFKQEILNPYVKIYSFADLLKKEVCIKILGLTHEQCFGTDEQKNELTHLLWEDMPGILTRGEYHVAELGLIKHIKGPMTAREVMQYVGTDIFRKMYSDVWVDATIRQIEEDDSLLAIVSDCRFPNEVEALQKAGGRVVRLLRAPFAEQDEHQSEKALDSFDFEKFDAIIDNRESDINKQCQQVYETLNQWGFVPPQEHEQN